MAAVAPQTSGPGAGAGQDWKTGLALPPRDTRVKTDVSMQAGIRAACAVGTIHEVLAVSPA